MFRGRFFALSFLRQHSRESLHARSQIFTGSLQRTCLHERRPSDTYFAEIREFVTAMFHSN